MFKDQHTLNLSIEETVFVRVMLGAVIYSDDD